MKFYLIFLLAGASSIFAAPTPELNLEERGGGNSNGVGNGNGIGNCNGGGNCDGAGNGNSLTGICNGNNQCKANCLTTLPLAYHYLCV